MSESLGHPKSLAAYFSLMFVFLSEVLPTIQCGLKTLHGKFQSQAAHGFVFVLWELPTY